MISEQTLFWESWLPEAAFLNPQTVDKPEKVKNQKSSESFAVNADSTQAATVPSPSLKKKSEGKSIYCSTAENFEYKIYIFSHTTDPCADHECRHAAPCIANGTTYSCKCPEGFVGRLCQCKIDTFLY